jgi:hypothetical protein
MSLRLTLITALPCGFPLNTCEGTGLGAGSRCRRALAGYSRRRQALAEPAGPPLRKRGTWPAPAIGPIQDVLDKLAGEPLTAWEIRTTVTDQHDSDASYAAIRDYIRSRRRHLTWATRWSPPVRMSCRSRVASCRCRIWRQGSVAVGSREILAQDHAVRAEASP